MHTSTSVSYLLRRVGRERRPDRADEQTQVARASDGDREAAGRVIGSNLPYVVRIASEFRGRGVLLDDLIAEGCVGLLKAIRRYRAANGTRFMTYASFWVRKEILAALSEQPNAVHVPRYARQHGFAAPRVLRLDGPKREDGNLSVADGLRHPGPSPAETLVESGEARHLRRHVSRLTARDQAVLAWRYGLGDQPQETLNEIALRLGLSRERVRQIEVAALLSLRTAMTARVGRVRHRQPHGGTMRAG